MNIIKSIFCCYNLSIQEANAEEINSSEINHLLSKTVEAPIAQNLLKLCDQINHSNPSDWDSIRMNLSTIKQKHFDSNTVKAINKVDQLFKNFQRAYLQDLASELERKSARLLNQATQALLISDSIDLCNIERCLQQLDVEKQKLANLEKLYSSIEEEENGE